jgi:hypothetical protein
MLAGLDQGGGGLPGARVQRRSWVSSQVSRARRDRADGSLSNSAGKSPKASTNSRMGPRQPAFGAGVSSNFSQVTQRLASPPG